LKKARRSGLRLRQSHPTGKEPKSIDFIEDCESHYSKSQATPSHSFEKREKCPFFKALSNFYGMTVD
jgi:hypothetical protein